MTSSEKSRQSEVFLYFEQVFESFDKKNRTHGKCNTHAKAFTRKMQTFPGKFKTKTHEKKGNSNNFL